MKHYVGEGKNDVDKPTAKEMCLNFADFHDKYVHIEIFLQYWAQSLVLSGYT